MISMDNTGGRTIQLFIPFEINGKKHTHITLAPLKFGHTLRWTAGDYKEAIELLVELSGVDDAVIREVRYPDAERLMESFLAIVTQDMREDIANGRVPQKRIDPEAQARVMREDYAAAQAALKTNGSGEPADAMPMIPQGPGVPLPETGFDLSDEQP